MTFVSEPRLPNGDRPVPIIRAAPGAKVIVLPLTNLYAACYGHWNGRTVWCEGEDRCLCAPETVTACSRRWLGWWPVMPYHGGRRAIVALTPLLALELRRVRLAGIDLRGRAVTLARQDQRPNSPTALSVGSPCDPKVKLPDWFDPTYHVLHALGVSARRQEQLYERGYSMMAREESDLDAWPN